MNVIVQADLFWRTAKSECDHLRHVQDRKFDIASDDLAYIILVGIHLEVTERAGGDHDVRIVVDGIYHGVTCEYFRGVVRLKFNVETATLVLVVVVDRMSLKRIDELVERGRVVWVLSAVARVVQFGGADVVTSVERCDVQVAERYFHFVLDVLKAVLVDETVEEVLDLGSPFVFKSDFGKFFIDSGFEVRVRVECMFRHGRVELAGVTDGDHGKTELLCVTDVSCIQYMCEEFVKILKVARAAAGCLFKNGDLDTQFVRYRESR